MKNELASVERASAQVGNLLTANGSSVVVGSDVVGSHPLDVPDLGGLTLGYTELTDNGVVNSTTSYAVIDADAKVTFTAPKSGNVEILVSLYIDDISSSVYDYFLGLSTASTYSALGNAYERKVAQQDTTDDQTMDVYFCVTGLTPGQSYTYYLGQKNSDLANKNRVLWGDGYPSLIMHAKSLPASIYTG